METEYPKILSSQEGSSMVSTWNEYLRLNKNDDNSAVLEICQYEVLGEAGFDEEGNMIVPPDIDPKDVVGIEDGCVVGGALTSEYGESFQFTAETISEAIEWLKKNRWECSADLLDDLAKAVGAKAQPTKTTP
jgi:hypothetical protein